MSATALVLWIWTNVLLALILFKLSQIAELIKDVDDNLDEVESTIERANR